jgi:hypothetical protein
MADREKKFSFLMTDREKAQLEALAAEESSTVANWLRRTIASQFAKKFGATLPPKPKREKKWLGNS